MDLKTCFFFYDILKCNMPNMYCRICSGQPFYYTLIDVFSLWNLFFRKHSKVPSRTTEARVWRTAQRTNVYNQSKSNAPPNKKVYIRYKAPPREHSMTKPSSVKTKDMRYDVKQHPSIFGEENIQKFSVAIFYCYSENL